MTNQHVVDLVERAVSTEPHCTTCGAPTVVVSDGPAIRLECSSLQHRRSLLQRLVAPDVAHTRRQLVDAEDLAA
jgi:hypothetical protein